MNAAENQEREREKQERVFKRQPSRATQPKGKAARRRRSFFPVLMMSYCRQMRTAMGVVHRVEDVLSACVDQLKLDIDENV